MEWIKCLFCGNEMDSDLADCTCESCGALDWSEPYPDDDEPETNNAKRT